MAKKKQTGNTRIFRRSKYKTKFTYTKTQLFAENKGFCVKCGAVKPGPRLTPKAEVEQSPRDFWRLIKCINKPKKVNKSV